jgi:hypothetical protein
VGGEFKYLFLSANRVISQSIIMQTLETNPSFPPLPTGRQALRKGGIPPLFGKEGLGEIFRKICLLNYCLFINCLAVIPVKLVLAKAGNGNPVIFNRFWIPASEGMTK